MPLSFNRALPRSALLGLAIFLAHSSTAQILMSGGDYSQDFNSLETSGNDVRWTNNITLFGWYTSSRAEPSEITTYDAGAGTSRTGGLFSFGSAGNLDRALGSLASETPIAIA